MTRNLGSTSLRRKRRKGNPMETFDALPAPVRQWMTHAALPWSPTSVRRIWSKSRARGLSDDEALALLARAETRTLARDRHATFFKLNSLS